LPTSKNQRPAVVTDRQATVLRLIGEGRTNREIADEIGISENGVKGHVARLLAKYEVPSRAALISAVRAADTPGANAGVVRVLRESLEEVLGANATSALLRRACKHAGVAADEILNGRDESPHTVGAVISALWPLLIEATGQVLVNRLHTRGFQMNGAVDPEEIATWIESMPRQN
jgi:DNA-binding CsgD family transcriptional regulator